MEKLSIIFCGSSDIAVPSLRALASDAAFNMKLVITQPDRAGGRGKKVQSTAVKIVADELGLPVDQPENINDHQLPPADYLVVVDYGQILEQPIIDHATIAPVNLHFSLLPRWRGAAPFQYPILEGDTETGVTIQKIIKKLDAGPIWSQESSPIGERETASDLRDRLTISGADLLCSTLKTDLELRDQDESQSTYGKKFSRADGVVDPETMTAEHIDRKVRALVPWPGVQCTINENPVKLIATELTPTDGALELSCADGTTLYITKLQSPGKRAMSAAEWQRGQRA